VDEAPLAGSCWDDSGGITFLVEKVLLKALLFKERTVPDKLILRFTNILEKMAEEVLAAALVVDEIA
jgi:hypothetical protein